MRRVQEVLACYAATALSGFLGCSPPTHVVVSVEGVPPQSVSLDVIGASGGIGSVNTLQPFALPQPTRSNTSFLLSLQDNLRGVSVSVAAFSGENAQGCLLAVGDAELPGTLLGHNDLRVALNPTNDTRCSPVRPEILGITPSLVSSAGGEKIAISGWGFKPLASVFMGSKQATNVVVQSASLITATTPSKAGFGLTPLRVVNTDA